MSLIVVPTASRLLEGTIQQAVYSISFENLKLLDPLRTLARIDPRYGLVPASR